MDFLTIGLYSLKIASEVFLFRKTSLANFKTSLHVFSDKWDVHEEIGSKTSVINQSDLSRASS